MTEIAAASVTSSAPPAAFFARWADVATWPEWDHGIEWVRLDGPFAQGTTGTLKPKGGPKTRFVIASLVDGREFVDVSRLPGARLTFAHYVTPDADGGCSVRVQVDVSGPLRRLWALILGKGVRASLQHDLDRLARVAEGAPAATA